MIGEGPQQQNLLADTQVLPVVAQRANGLSVPRWGADGDSVPNRTLTRAERRLSVVLADPAHHASTNQERADAARISLTRYYEILRDPWFKDQQRTLMQSHFQGALASVVTAAVETARRPGRDGFNDRRMILEVANVYVPRQQVDHTTQGKPIVGVVGVSLDEL